MRLRQITFTGAPSPGEAALIYYVRPHPARLSGKVSQGM